jgi:hypothetical protein
MTEKKVRSSSGLFKKSASPRVANASNNSTTPSENGSATATPVTTNSGDNSSKPTPKK